VGSGQEGEVAMTEEPVGQPAPGLDLVIITGLSGAGRSTAAKALEDVGYFVVDSLPTEMATTLVELAGRSQGAVTRMALGMDVRSYAFSADLLATIRALRSRGYRPRVIYLEATEEELVARYEAQRRKHPLSDHTPGSTLLDCIRAEREMLAEVRGEADLVVDTSRINVNQLRAQVESQFTSHAANTMVVTVLSFGYKYGLPVDADIVFDMRFLPNPHWVPELRAFPGTDPEVSKYVLSSDGAGEFLDAAVALLRIAVPGLEREGKKYLTVAIGCTGGKHRSVATSEELARRLAADGIAIRVVHRDLGRE
jgi:UPF0042 nucleotide-binding protein